MNDFIDLQRIVVVTLRRWWLLALVTAAGTMLGFSIGRMQTPVYEATTTVLVGQIFHSTNIDRQEILTSELVAQTYSDLVRRQPVLQAVVDNLKLGQSWQQLKKRVSVELVEGTQLIQITVQADSSFTAQVIADEVARQMILFSPAESNPEESEAVRQFVQQQLENIQARIESGQDRLALYESTFARAGTAEMLIELQAEANTLESLITNWENTYIQLLSFLQTGQSPNTLTIIEPAQADPEPVRPQVQFIGFFGGGLGFLVALGLIFLFEYLDDTYKTPEEIRREFDLPVLGSIRNEGKRRSKDLPMGVYVSKHPQSPIAEDYRLLRANLELISLERPFKTIMITGCERGVGKSMVSTNLAISMAHSDREVILLDADLYNSNIHHLMNLQNELGLSDILHNNVEVPEVLQTWNGTKGGVITGGTSPVNASDLLGSRKMDQLLTELNEISDVVIIDAPPLMVSDAILLSAKVDGVLLVIRLDRTRRKLARATLERLNLAGARVIGVVLSGVKTRGLEDSRTYRNTFDESEKINGRLPAARKRWSLRSFVLEKLGSSRSGISSREASSGEGGESYPVQEGSSGGDNPEENANPGEFVPNQDFPENGKFRGETQMNVAKPRKPKKEGQR